MPKARYLASWQQEDVLAALEAEEGLTKEEIAALRGKPAIYHPPSRKASV